MEFLNDDSGVDFSEFLNKLHSLSIKYYHSFNPFKVFSSVFSRQDILQLKEFAKNKDIIVCKPDKGRGVVILDKDTYVAKMIDLISDRTKFENISISIKKYTLKIEDKIKKILRKLKDENIILSETYSKLYTTGSSPGILYGLPKIHKPVFVLCFSFDQYFLLLTLLATKFRNF